MSESSTPPSEAPVGAPETPETISLSPEQPADVVAEQAARIAELEQQVKDVQLRAQADVQNIQRRAERDVTAAHKFALEKFAGSLLDIVDNLERAVQSSTSDDPAVQSLREGVELTHKLFIDTLKRFAVEVVDPVGQPFDPELHQAVSTQPSETAEPNTVAAVFQKGYTLSGRLLRPAMVVVAS